MKISTEISSTANYVGERAAIEKVAKAGFDAWDYSMFRMINFDWKNYKAEFNYDAPWSGDYVKFSRELKKIGENNGICCNQAHAPFPTGADGMDKCIKIAIESAAEAGAGIIIVHPVNNFTPEQNAEIYGDFLPFAKQHGIKIAVENMYNWNHEKGIATPAACCDCESFLATLDAVNSEYLVACLDLGHAEMMGNLTSDVKMIDALGGYLQALHIHDNDRRVDRHQIPFSMDIDFEPIVGALKRNNYKGYFTLEADNYINSVVNKKGYSEDILNTAIADLARAAKKLAVMFETRQETK